MRLPFDCGCRPACPRVHNTRSGASRPFCKSGSEPAAQARNREMFPCSRCGLRSISFECYRLQTLRDGSTRSGAVLVAALVCLLIVMSILGTMLQSSLRTGRQLHVERDRQQAEFLLQAGADRAARLFATDPEFRGDTWTLPAEAILGHGGGVVTTSLARIGRVALAIAGRARNTRWAATFRYGVRVCFLWKPLSSIEESI